MSYKDKLRQHADEQMMERVFSTPHNTHASLALYLRATLVVLQDTYMDAYPDRSTAEMWEDIEAETERG